MGMEIGHLFQESAFVNHMLSIAETEYKPFVLGNARALLNKKKIFDKTTMDKGLPI